MLFPQVLVLEEGERTCLRPPALPSIPIEDCHHPFHQFSKFLLAPLVADVTVEEVARPLAPRLVPIVHFQADDDELVSGFGEEISWIKPRRAGGWPESKRRMDPVGSNWVRYLGVSSAPVPVICNRTKKEMFT